MNKIKVFTLFVIVVFSIKLTGCASSSNTASTSSTEAEPAITDTTKAVEDLKMIQGSVKEIESITEDSDTVLVPLRNVELELRDEEQFTLKRTKTSIEGEFSIESEDLISGLTYFLVIRDLDRQVTITTDFEYLPEDIVFQIVRNPFDDDQRYIFRKRNLKRVTTSDPTTVRTDF